MMELWFKHLVNLIQLMSWTAASYPDSPISCLSHSRDLVALSRCLNSFTIPHGHYTAETYALAQPTHREREDWEALVTSALSASRGCKDIAIPYTLQPFYAAATFQDHHGEAFCVITETDATRHRGWGHFIVPVNPKPSITTLHISAPHPNYDLGTVEQASAVFKLSGARSLLIAGRARSAFLAPSNCTSPSDPTKHYFATDASHDTHEPFVDASIAIHSWQTQQDGPFSFIQVHGKSARTCPQSQIFLSSGTSCKAWYANRDHFISRLHRELQLSFPQWNVSLPPNDEACPLLATKNVFGRYVNGVPRSRLCDTVPYAISGNFVHVEQAPIARSPQSYRHWARALRAAIGTS